jgi:hypothetical protein
MNERRLIAWSLLGAALLGATSVGAQSRGWGREGRYTEPIRDGLPEQRTGFLFCRLQYDMARRFPSGYGWSTDYPRSDRNFMTRLPQLTNTRVTHWSDGEPGHAVVRATDPDIFLCPFVFASDIGTVGLSGEEIEALREYLVKGGFLWVDDFWGERAWSYWADEIQRVFPEYPIQELTREHPLFDSYYTLPKVPQIPSIQSWYDTGGLTQERGFEPGDPHMGAIIDNHGRILVLMTHNTDIADGWEREQDNEDFFYRFTAQAYGVGINVAIWVMTH